MIELTVKMIDTLKELNVIRCELENDDNSKFVNIKKIILKNDERLSPAMICKLMDANFNVYKHAWSYIIHEDNPNLITINVPNEKLITTKDIFSNIHPDKVYDWFWAQFNNKRVSKGK